MSTSTPTDPRTPGKHPQNDEVVAPNFEESLRKFWEKNSKLIYVSCAAVFIVILVRGGLKWMHTQKENDIASAYAAASTTERLRTFAAANPGHQLGAAAQLRIADEAYAAGKYADAIASYDKAAGVFKTGPFGGRALLGSAISKVRAGQTAEGEAKLKQLANDSKQLKTVRAEAAYHAAMIATDAGRTEDAVKFFDLVSSLDPASNWAQRSMMHRATLAAPTPSLVPAAVTP